MENIAKCPVCHVSVLPTHYYCYNCGNNLRPAPPKIDAFAQIVLYAKSLLLPPFGALWAIKYLKQPDTKSKMVGVIAIVMTVVSFVIAIILFNNFMTTLNTQVN